MYAPARRARNAWLCRSCAGRAVQSSGTAAVHQQLMQFVWFVIWDVRNLGKQAGCEPCQIVHQTELAAVLMHYDRGCEQALIVRILMMSTLFMPPLTHVCLHTSEAPAQPRIGVCKLDYRQMATTP